MGNKLVKLTHSASESDYVCTNSTSPLDGVRVVWYTTTANPKVTVGRSLEFDTLEEALDWYAAEFSERVDAEVMADGFSAEEWRDQVQWEWEAYDD